MAFILGCIGLFLVAIGAVLAQRTVHRQQIMLDDLASVAKQAQAEQERLRDQLAQASKMESLGAMAGGIAHDLSSILTGIHGWAELLKSKEGLDPEIRRYRENIEQGAGRARDLALQVLCFSQRITTQRKKISLQSLVREVESLVLPTLPPGIRIVTDFSGQPVQIVADMVQVHRAVLNLFTNAIASMKEKGGTLTVRIAAAISPEEISEIERHAAGQSSREWVWIEVADTGDGISTDKLGKIFEPFFTTKQRGEGRGLGLTVVQGVASEHGGFVTVRSTVGNGTSFRIFFPVDGVPAQVENSGGAAPGAPVIMVIDDEPLIVELVTEMLAELGFAFEGYTDPSKALARIQAAPAKYGVVLCDQTMPIMSGLELIKRAAKNAPATAFVLSSGFTTQSVDELFEDIDCKPLFLKKPYKFENLCGILEKALGTEVRRPHVPAPN